MVQGNGLVCQLNHEELELLNLLGGILSIGQRKLLEQRATEFGKRNPRFRGALNILNTARRNPHQHHLGLELKGQRKALVFTVSNGQPFYTAGANWHLGRLFQGHPELVVVRESVPVVGIEGVVNLASVKVDEAAAFVANAINPVLQEHGLRTHATNVRPNEVSSVLTVLQADYEVSGLYLAKS